MRKTFIDQALYEKERDLGLLCPMCLKQKRRDVRFKKRLKEPSNFLQMPMRSKWEKYHLNQMRNLLKEKNLKRFVVGHFFVVICDKFESFKLLLPANASAFYEIHFQQMFTVHCT